MTSEATSITSEGPSMTNESVRSSQTQDTVRFITGHTALPARREKKVGELQGYSDWKQWNCDMKQCLKANNLYGYFVKEQREPTEASGPEGNEAANGFIENLLIDTVSPEIASLARLTEYDTFPEIFAAIEDQIKSRNKINQTKVGRQWRSLKFTTLEETICQIHVLADQKESLSDKPITEDERIAKLEEILPEDLSMMVTMRKMDKPETTLLEIEQLLAARISIKEMKSGRSITKDQKHRPSTSHQQENRGGRPGRLLLMKKKWCTHCSKKTHNTEDCWFENQTEKPEKKEDACYNCERKGHFAKDCRQPRKNSRPAQQTERNQGSKTERNKRGFQTLVAE